MVWTRAKEKELVKLKKSGLSYREIGLILGTTLSGVRHKLQRIQKANNQDKFKHTKEKIGFIKHHISLLSGNDLNILETHCGYGGLTKFYSEFGRVMAFDIEQEKLDSINSQNLPNVITQRGDIEKEIYSLVAQNLIFKIVDVDPYGFPSKLFPHVFNLIDDGLLFLTFPALGVAQLNKITIRHYEAFWGISVGKDNEKYLEKIVSRLRDYAFMSKRGIEILSIDRIGSVYRLSIKVDRQSLLRVVGLKVNRRKIVKSENLQMNLEL